MRRIAFLALSAGFLGAAVFWQITMPRALPLTALDGLSGDEGRGEVVFTAAGCASCHMAPDSKGEDQRNLLGGQAFATQFGTFYAPNISPDMNAGIGGWSDLDLANAIMKGVTPEGSHYFPALPYWSYERMAPQDLVDLAAYLRTLPADPTPSKAHDVGFPFNIRRMLGGWKFLNMRPDFVIDGDLTEAEIRGRYLAEALAHCGECHTPRDALGGLDTSRWLAGSVTPDGKGKIPNITPAKLTWSEEEIVEYLTSGFTPEFDSVGGHMAHVVDNMARLPEEDRHAIASYLKKVPPAE